MPIRREKLARVLVLACLLTAASAGQALASPGDRDQTFGGNGKVNTNFTGGADFANGVALQKNGKIVAAGLEGHGRFGLARYLPDGHLDPTFSDDGKVSTNFTPETDFARAVAIQPDGKIVAAGFAGDKATFAVARYHDDGHLDNTFSGDGKFTTNFTSGDDAAYGLALQADGKIVVAGSAREGNGDAMFALARYDTSGHLDRTFGDNGKLVTNFTPKGDTAFAVAVQPDGKVVAAGRAGYGSNSSMALARYLPGGRLDPAFSGDGKVTTNLTAGDDYANAVAVQLDGKIVAAGTGGYTDFAVVRYGPHGGLDDSFGGDGKVFTDVSVRDDIVHGVAVQLDGKIVAAGSAREGYPDATFALARYWPHGGLDRSFGGDGTVRTNFSPWGDYANAVAIQSDGKIVAAGQAAGSGGRFALARYLP